MSNRKIFISYIILVCILVLGSAILTIINLIDIIRFSREEVNVTFISAVALFVVGIGCLILLIKKLFHNFYIKIYPIVDNASDLANGNVVSEKRSYKNLKILIIVIFLITIILQLVVLIA